MNQHPRDWAMAQEVGGYTLSELLGNMNAVNTNAALKLQRAAQAGIGINGAKLGLDAGQITKFGSMAGGPRALTALKFATPIAAVGGVMGAADVLAGDGSAGKKIRDGTAMTIGGILGAAGGPVGIAAGAGAGKMVSDVGGWLLGEKSAEEIRMEEALRQLRGIG